MLSIDWTQPIILVMLSLREACVTMISQWKSIFRWKKNLKIAPLLAKHDRISGDSTAKEMSFDEGFNHRLLAVDMAALSLFSGILSSLSFVQTVNERIQAASEDLQCNLFIQRCFVISPFYQVLLDWHQRGLYFVKEDIFKGDTLSCLSNIHWWLPEENHKKYLLLKWHRHGPSFNNVCVDLCHSHFDSRWYLYI